MNQPDGRATDDHRVPRTVTAYVVSGLDRQLLEHAALSVVMEEPDSAPAVAAAYRRLDREGLLAAEWWGHDLLPLQVTLTPLGRAVLRAARRLTLQDLSVGGTPYAHLS